MISRRGVGVLLLRRVGTAFFDDSFTGGTVAIRANRVISRWEHVVVYGRQ